MAKDLNIPLLGQLPLDPLLARCCDEGRDYLSEMPDSPAVKSLKLIVDSEFCIQLVEIAWEIVWGYVWYNAVTFLFYLDFTI